MDLLMMLLTAATTTPTPVPDDNYNSPGTIGFLVTFGIAAIAVGLFFDMNRRVRRTRYRTEIRAKLAAEELMNLEVEKPTRPEPPTKPQRVNPESD
ncbi:MAG: hypothetical protein RL068_879 [Actinomycetota bacterium]|jgi:hypothetical protein